MYVSLSCIKKVSSYLFSVKMTLWISDQSKLIVSFRDFYIDYNVLALKVTICQKKRDKEKAMDNLWLICLLSRLIKK
jgi:hypothetical protein